MPSPAVFESGVGPSARAAKVPTDSSVVLLRSEVSAAPALPMTEREQQLWAEILRLRDAVIGSVHEAGRFRGEAYHLYEMNAELRNRSAPDDLAGYHREMLEAVYKSQTWKLGWAILAPLRFLRRDRRNPAREFSAAK